MVLAGVESYVRGQGPVDGKQRICRSSDRSKDRRRECSAIRAVRAPDVQRFASCLKQLWRRIGVEEIGARFHATPVRQYGGSVHVGTSEANVEKVSRDSLMVPSMVGGGGRMVKLAALEKLVGCSVR